MASTLYFALVPAAGGGSRMGTTLPKQYLPLCGQPLIRHALTTLCAVPQIDRVFVVLAPDDEYWPEDGFADLVGKLRVLHCGGATRAESVANGLRAMGNVAAEDDWVLVHDAARACLTVDHVETLIRSVGHDMVGGILGVPVADTVKREAYGRIAPTVSRESLWQAQTPQMFRHGLLSKALAHAPSVTDEAGAIEALGLKPKLVAADATNLKVTYPLDLKMAEWIIDNRTRS
ncbi:MAG: 2-C-methyl-D-erythritol 4-phosphate cytidylyltransferase [Rhodocyclales bacterium]|nr:2-C-methyl-D-erythritol 4-phosphate cytidylyltransferase [Rhodocyclales bacterium]